MLNKQKKIVSALIKSLYLDIMVRPQNTYSIGKNKLNFELLCIFKCLSNIIHKDIRPLSFLLCNAQTSPRGFLNGVDWRALVKY